MIYFIINFKFLMFISELQLFELLSSQGDKTNNSISMLASTIKELA